MVHGIAQDGRKVVFTPCGLITAKKTNHCSKSFSKITCPVCKVLLFGGSL